jgi:hypothetical protein
MVRAVHDGNARVRPVKMFAEFQAAKTRSENNDMLSIRVRHERNFSESKKNAIGRIPVMREFSDIFNAESQRTRSLAGLKYFSFFSAPLRLCV